MKRSIMILASLFLICRISPAQNDSFRKRYDDFKQESSLRQASFREICNKSYADFLRKAWEVYRSTRVEKPREEPLPPVKFNDKLVEDKVIEIRDTILTLPIPQRPGPAEPVKTTPRPMEPRFVFDFYGQTFTVRADKGALIHLPSTSEDDVADVWNGLSGGKFDSSLEDLLNIRDVYDYCDWAYLQLVQTFASSFSSDGDDASILSAWLLCQSGYKIRLARADCRLCILFSSEYTIYGKNYFIVDGEKFYCINSDASRIHIASACSYPKEQGLSFALDRLPSLLVEHTPDRTLTSEKYSSASVSSSVNSNLIKFMDSYPDTQYGDNYMTRWAIYADTPIDDYSKGRIYPSLRHAIEGKDELEAVNILLNFVQTALEYEYDDKVWGHDRVFFAEETLYYDYCDCEDRSILFSRLVRDLIGLDVALIYYPNHLATAVKFTSPVSGDYFVLDGGKYTVCDPTYIGAPVGASMPSMEGKKATLIQLGRQ